MPSGASTIRPECCWPKSASSDAPSFHVFMQMRENHPGEGKVHPHAYPIWEMTTAQPQVNYLWYRAHNLSCGHRGPARLIPTCIEDHAFVQSRRPKDRMVQDWSIRRFHWE